MKELIYRIGLVENSLLKWADINSHSFLRVTIGIVYILYGGLKLFPHYSPAEQLAVDTIEKLSLGFLSGSPAIISLGIMEILIGLCLVFRFRLRWIIYAAIGHIMGTFLPVFFFPEAIFTDAPISLSLVGQYIMKNLIIIGALFVLYAKTVNRQSKVILFHSSREDTDYEGFTHDNQLKKEASLMPDRKINSR